MDKKNSWGDLSALRLAWFVRCLSGLVYSVCMAAAAWGFGEGVFQWDGLLGRPAPLPDWSVVAVPGLLTPPFILLCRYATAEMRQRIASGECGGETTPRSRVVALVRAEVVFATFAEAPVLAVLIWAALFGALLPLWVVAAEYTAAMLAYYTRAGYRAQPWLAEVS